MFLIVFYSFVSIFVMNFTVVVNDIVYICHYFVIFHYFLLPHHGKHLCINHTSSQTWGGVKKNKNML